MKRVGLGFTMVFVLLIGLVGIRWLIPPQAAEPVSARQKDAGPIQVMAVGSSVTEGWVDKSGGGYLKRLFQGLSYQQGAHYELTNKAMSGAGVLQVTKLYSNWLQTIKPQIVVLSWGALDDLHNKTPLSVVEQQIQWEIQQATADHAVVFVMTPLITRASYTSYLTQEQGYANAEVKAAESLHNPNVYVFDVYGQMKAYLVAHRQSYVPYMADGWHPNSAGHALAAQLLLADIKKQFGTNPPVFKTA